METLKNWLATGVIALLMLIICGVLDASPEATTCVGEIKDSYGHLHIFSGRIAKVDVQ